MLPPPVDRRRKSPPPKSTDLHHIEILSSDPEVNFLQGMIVGMHHMNERQLSLRHFKLILAVSLATKAYNQPEPTRKMLSTISRIPFDELDPELSELCEKKYLHEVLRPFEPIRTKYKMGSMGGTILRHVFSPVLKDSITS